MMNGLWLLFIFFPMIVQADVVSELGSYERCEDISGTTFKYKLFFDDDEIMKDFFIDNERVDKDVYNARKYEAYDKELEEAQQQLKKLYEEQNAIQCAVRSKGYLKLINEIKQKIEALLHLLRDKSLEPFLAFDEGTISSVDSLDHIHGKFLPSLAFIDDEDALNEGHATLKKLFELCEELYAILSQFYKESVERAIDKADDPTDLKKLLELI